MCSTILAASIIGLPADSHGQSISFTKVADTSTAIPGGTGNFSGVCTRAGSSAGGGRPAIDAGTVVFHGRGIGFFGGLYKYADGVLSRVVDSTTPIPNSGGEVFSAVGGWPSIDGDSVTFWGRGVLQEGVYTNSAGAITVVADRSTPIPGGSGNFGFFGNMTSSPRDHNDNAVFYANDAGNFSQEGIYTDFSGSLSVVADLNTPVPDGTGTFGPIGGGSAVFSLPNIHENTTAFRGRGVNQVGIYKQVGAVLSRVADLSTPLPGSVANFGGATRIDVHNGQVGFIAGQAGPHGIYVDDGGILRVVADQNTPIPEGSGNFGTFAELSLHAGKVAFWGSNTQGTQQGIYTDFDGPLTKVIDLNDTLDGKVITTFRTGDGSLSANQIAFCAFFEDASNGVFVATLPSGSPPVAEAGADQSIRAGQTAFLDGSDSFDDNTATPDLLFDWSFDSTPPGSIATLDGPSTAMPSFVADLPGVYVVELVVTDEDGLSSNPDAVTVSSDNLAPTAVVEADQLVFVGDTVNLDGMASSDPEGDALNFTWTITAAPVGSIAVLSDATAASTSFVPDVAGAYTVTLSVSDFIGPGTPDEVEITAATAEDLAIAQILAADEIVAALGNDDVTTAGNQRAFRNFLRQAVIAIQAGDTEEAIDKVQKAIMRSDGCALRGEPDAAGPGRDWITNCAAQVAVYAALESALMALTQ